jgi:outer membrane protein assembly factor BamB
MLNIHTGSIVWQKTGYVNTPAVTANGSIVAMNRPSLVNPNTLVALDVSGDVIWSTVFDTGASSDIVCDPTNLFFTAGVYLWKLTLGGGLVWKFPLSTYSGMTPSIDSEGNLYVGDGNGYLYSVFPNGKLRWSQKFNSGFLNREWTTIDNLHQSLYVLVNTQLLALKLSDGTTKFTILSNSFSELPSIGNDGTIYLVQTLRFSLGVNVSAYDPISGKLRWSTGVPSNEEQELRGPLSLTKDGILYVLTNELSAVDSKLGKVLWSLNFPASKDFTNSPTILPDGSLLISSDYCYASRVTGLSLPPTPTPTSSPKPTPKPTPTPHPTPPIHIPSPTPTPTPSPIPTPIPTPTPFLLPLCCIYVNPNQGIHPICLQNTIDCPSGSNGFGVSSSFRLNDCAHCTCF